MSLLAFRRLVLLTIDVLLVGGIGAAALQSPAVALVSGRVVDAETGAPVRFVQVELLSNGKGAYRGVTGEDGMFAFDSVQEGIYYLGAGRAGHPPVYYSTVRNPAPAPGAPIPVAAGQRIEGIELAMPRGGAISGRVTDEDGHPVSLSLTVVNAGLRPSPNPVYFSFGYQGTSWRSDGEGRFRIYGLAAGEYFLIADLNGTYVPDHNGRRVTFTRAFSPNTTDPLSAAPLPVAAGQERAGVNLTIRRVPLLTVSGSVSKPDGSQYVAVWFKPVSRRPIYLNGQNTSVSQPGNHFKHTDLAPGRYWVTAVTRTPRPPDAPKGTRPTLWWALAQIVLTDQDISDLALAMQPALTLSGKVELQAGESTDGLFIALAPAGDDIPPIDEREGAFPVGADGRFEISNATPGRYRIVVTAGRNPVTVASTALGGRVLESGEFDVSVGSTINDLVIRIRR